MRKSRDNINWKYYSRVVGLDNPTTGLMDNTIVSSKIADAIAAFSKQIHETASNISPPVSLTLIISLQFQESERKAHQDIARSVADALQARNERDNANRLLHEAQIETLQWKQEVVSLKGAVRCLLS
jgi:hypothetical protein